MIEEGWDAICVGGGLTSLALGALAARSHPGRRILVLDRHAVTGGYASMFPRPKAAAEFDCSLHKVSGANPDGGNLHRVLERLGLADTHKILPSKHFFEACLPDETLLLAADTEAFHTTLQRRFPADAKGLDQFFAELSSYGRDSYYLHQILNGSHSADLSRLRWAHRNLRNITVAEALDRRIADPYLKELLALPTIYVGGFAEDLSYLYYLHVLYATLCAGCGYVAGGAQRLSDALARMIEEAGGRVLLRTPVQTIEPATDGGLHAVTTQKGRFTAPEIYINAAPLEAVDGLMRDVPGLESVRTKLAAIKSSWSTTTLYLTTDEDPDRLGLGTEETMIVAPQDGAPRSRRERLAESGFDPELCEELLWWNGPIEVTNYHALNPAAGRVVCVNVLDCIQHWPERRSPAYKVRKKRAEWALLERLYAAKPGLRGHVVFTELATPRTYHRFTRNTDGAGFGAMVGPGSSGHNFHHFFPFPGIQFLSAWVAGSGYEAALTYAEAKVDAWQPAGASAAASTVPAAAQSQVAPPLLKAHA